MAVCEERHIRGDWYGELAGGALAGGWKCVGVGGGGGGRGGGWRQNPQRYKSLELIPSFLKLLYLYELLKCFYSTRGKEN